MSRIVLFIRILIYLIQYFFIIFFFSYYLGERLKKANPFEKTGFSNLVTKLKAYAKQHNINLETLSAKMKSREKNVVAKTIHGAGIVSPFNKKSQVGYRELSVTDSKFPNVLFFFCVFIFSLKLMIFRSTVKNNKQNKRGKR